MTNRAERLDAVSEEPAPQGGRPSVVVIGAGFGGLEAVRHLAALPVHVLLLDRNNYHLFTPLLYQVATAGLEPEEIAQPVRTILRGLDNVHFRVTEVTAVDLDRRSIETAAGPIAYDYLVLAAGSTTNFFGNAGIEQHALGLKDLPEAMALRNHILAQFEAAVWEPDPGRRAVYLSFVIVGGGPTGIEFAGALSELIRHCLNRDYPGLDIGEVRILLLEAADRVLPAMAPRLQRAALKALRAKGVVVQLHTAVERIDGSTVHLHGGETVSAATVLWAAGVRASDLAGTLPVPHARANRVSVLPTLQLAGHPEVFAIGDMAAAEQGGAVLPMVAPVAIQAGKLAAENIARLISGRQPTTFRYRDRGVMATIGRNAAVAQVGPLRFTGFIAWLMWLTLHLIWLVGFRNRVLVFINWIWNYLVYDRAVRLILSAGPPARPEKTPSSEE